jgi:parallel beta-helix repeat protein
LIVDPTGAKGAFATVQAAINAAHPGDFIAVRPGVYTEQLTLTAADRGVQLEATVPLQAVLEAPNVLTASGAIVDVNGAAGVEIEGFTIKGPVAGSAHLQAGILVENGGSALIEENHLTDIQDAVFSGLQEGVGVEVGRSPFAGQATTGKATIRNNQIDSYQKGGVVVANTGSQADIADNVIRGVGPTSVLAQNGVEISDGATGDVEDNVVSGNVYVSPVQPPEFAAAGILLFQTGKDVEIEHNVVVRNDAGIWAVDVADAEIHGNFVSGSAFFGIALDVASTGSSGNTVSGNVVVGNSGDGIDLFSAANNKVIDNVVVGNGGAGIALDDTSVGNKVHGNHLGLNAGGDLVASSATTKLNHISGNHLRTVGFDLKDLGCDG